MKKILNSKTLIALAIMANLLVQVSCNTEEENSGITDYNIELADSDTQKVGKSTLTVKVTEKESGTTVSGLNVALVPWMDMGTGTMKHSAPVPEISDNGDGTYSGTVYYLMPTSAPTGMKMGDWTVKVKINDAEKAELPVTVTGMTTDKITLKGQADKYLNMDMVENRKYFLFVNEIKSDSNTGFSIQMFLATRESMEKHPYVYSGRGLMNEVGEPWIVTTVQLEISLDGTGWTPVQESADKDGTYQVTGFSGLTTGTEVTLYFRLTVNNEQKTTNGDAPDKNTTNPANTNEFGKLTVTP